MNYLSESGRKMLEATLYNLYLRSDRSAELPNVLTNLSLITDSELEQLLNKFLLM